MACLRRPRYLFRMYVDYELFICLAGSVWRWCWTKKLLLAGFCRVRSFLVDLLEAHDNDSLLMLDVLLCYSWLPSDTRRPPRTPSNST